MCYILFKINTVNILHWRSEELVRLFKEYKITSLTFGEDLIIGSLRPSFAQATYLLYIECQTSFWSSALLIGQAQQEFRKKIVTESCSQSVISGEEIKKLRLLSVFFFFWNQYYFKNMNFITESEEK